MNKIFFSRLKTGAVMFAVAGAMAFSGAAGAAGTAFAKDPGTYPNYLDTDYSLKV